MHYVSTMGGYHITNLRHYCDSVQIVPNVYFVIVYRRIVGASYALDTSPRGMEFTNYTYILKTIHELQSCASHYIHKTHHTSLTVQTFVNLSSHSPLKNTLFSLN